jgi:hypothetical protein
VVAELPEQSDLDSVDGSSSDADSSLDDDSASDELEEPDEEIDDEAEAAADTDDDAVGVVVPAGRACLFDDQPAGDMVSTRTRNLLAVQTISSAPTVEMLPSVGLLGLLLCR